MKVWVVTNADHGWDCVMAVHDGSLSYEEVADKYRQYAEDPEDENLNPIFIHHEVVQE